ncbi:MAG: hypothetical protein GX444_15810 [Myxococcales bacterium]|nr:hypothetical protein [Myxococcales bacterium]
MNLHSRLQKSRKTLVALWPAHLAAFFIGLMFLHYSPVLGHLKLKPSYRFAEVHELGLQLVEVAAPSGGRLEQVDFHYPLSSGETLDLFFKLPTGRYAELFFSAEGAVTARSIAVDQVETITRHRAPAGRYRIRFEEGRPRLVGPEGEIATALAGVTGDLPAYVRVGPRLLNKSVLPPTDLLFEYHFPDQQGKTVVRQFSWWIYWPIMAAICLLGFLLLFVLPLALLSLLLSKEALQVIELSLALLLPFSPGFFIYSFVHRDAIKPYDFSNLVYTDQSAGRSGEPSYQRILPARQPGEQRVLLIGGSVPRGNPAGVDQSMAAVVNRLSREQGRPVVVINGAQNGWMISRWAEYLPELTRISQADTVMFYGGWVGFNVTAVRVPTTFYLLFIFYGSPQWVPLAWMYDSKRAEKLFTEYDIIQDRTRRLGVRWIVIDDAIPRWDPSFQLYSAFRRNLLEHLEKKGVEVISLFEPFLKAENDFLFYDMDHLTPAGQELAGRLIWEYLNRESPTGGSQ